MRFLLPPHQTPPEVYHVKSAIARSGMRGALRPCPLSRARVREWPPIGASAATDAKRFESRICLPHGCPVRPIPIPLRQPTDARPARERRSVRPERGDLDRAPPGVITSPASKHSIPALHYSLPLIGGCLPRACVSSDATPSAVLCRSLDSGTTTTASAPCGTCARG